VLEKNLTTTQQHINTLEQQMNAVETANLNLETVKVMKEASDAMKGMNKRVGIDDVDATMCVHSNPPPTAEAGANKKRPACFGLRANIEKIAGRRYVRTCNSTTKYPRPSQAFGLQTQKTKRTLRQCFKTWNSKRWMIR
jgi:hypothetical protein